MGKVKKKKPEDKRPYRRYSDEDLLKAMEDLRKPEATRPSLRQDANKYGIPHQTLSNKMNGKHQQSVERPTALSAIEEQSIVNGLLTLSDWGFPVGPFDLRKIVQDYLNSMKKDISFFHNNLPGKDFMKGFLKRHRVALRARIVPNYSKKRASVTAVVLNQYFDNLEETPRSSFGKHMETNLSDNPGRKQCIVRRGVKYPKRIMNETKSCISLMVCGSAAGQLMPPFVVYKAKSLYGTWRMGGPKGARYSTSPSGWFDAKTFEEWFFSSALEILKKQDGPKVLMVNFYLIE